MPKEKKTVELKDEELEKVAGGWKHGEEPTIMTPQPQQGGIPSCYYHSTGGLQMMDYYPIKASCEGCDYIKDCINKYIIE